MASRAELHGQTALRGLASLTVFLAHASFYQFLPGLPWLAGAYHVFLWHNEAVDLFFVLSGFVLCYVYRSKSFTWNQYALARFSRIYPLYLLSLVVMLAVNFAQLTGENIAPKRELLANVLLVQDWPFVPYFASFDRPAWSISVEVFLYIFAFPFLLYLQRYTTPWQEIILAIAPVALLTAFYFFVKSDFEAATAPYRGILCFTSGFFTCCIGLERKFARVPRRVEFFILALAGVSLIFAFPFGRGLAVITFPLLAYFAAVENSLLSTCISRPLFCWLGDISYSIYLWHWPILTAFEIIRPNNDVSTKWAGSSFLDAALYSLFFIALVLMVSHLSHFYLSGPSVSGFEANKGTFILLDENGWLFKWTTAGSESCSELGVHSVRAARGVVFPSRGHPPAGCRIFTATAA